MILRSLHVEGFGIHRDLHVDELAPGLNLVLGRNEAGKSTLHAFVRAVLFGFPAANSKEYAHPPVQGGVHGGALFLEARGELWQLRRVGRGKRDLTLKTADGEEREIVLLHELLRGADARLFKSVFAFGLDELAGLQGLDADEVGMRLFDAGLTGAARSVRELVVGLRQRADEQLGRRGGRIRELQKALIDAEKRRDSLVAQASAQGERLRVEAGLEDELGVLRQKREEARALAARLATLTELRPVARRWIEGRLWLRQATEAELDRLATESAVAVEQARRAASLGQEAEVAAARLRELAADLGEGWDVERLLGIECGIERRDRLRTLGAQLEESEDELRRAREERDRRASEVEALREELEVARAGGVLQPPEPDEIERLRVALAELRAARGEWSELRQRAPSLALVSLGPVVALLAAASMWASGMPLEAALLLFVGLVAAAVGMRLSRRSARLRECEARMAALAKVAGTPSLPGPGDLEQAALRLERIEARSAEAKERGRLAEAAARVFEQAKRALEEAERGRLRREEALELIRAVWRDETAEIDGLRPSAALEVLAAAREARVAEETMRRAAKEAEELRRRVEGVVAAGSAALGIAFEAPIAELARRLAEARDEARGAAEAWRQLTSRLGALGEATTAEAIEALFAPASVAAWLEERVAADEALAKLDAAIAAGHERLALCRQERERIESADALAEQELEVTALRRELADAVERFREARLLERLLLDSLDSFRQERQPEVLRLASAHFADATAGRWCAVRQAADGEELEVVDLQGRALPATRLSRGARELLYLCARLALAEVFAERGTRLPLLMDDVLVNFDPQRAEGAAAVLAEVSRRHQILLFTCHPQTLQLLRRYAPDARLFELGMAEADRLPSRKIGRPAASSA